MADTAFGTTITDLQNALTAVKVMANRAEIAANAEQNQTLRQSAVNRRISAQSDQFDKLQRYGIDSNERIARIQGGGMNTIRGDSAAAQMNAIEAQIKAGREGRIAAALELNQMKRTDENIRQVMGQVLDLENTIRQEAYRALGEDGSLIKPIVGPDGFQTWQSQFGPGAAGFPSSAGEAGAEVPPPIPPQTIGQRTMGGLQGALLGAGQSIAEQIPGGNIYAEGIGSIRNQLQGQEPGFFGNIYSGIKNIGSMIGPYTPLGLIDSGLGSLNNAISSRNVDPSIRTGDVGERVDENGNRLFYSLDEFEGSGLPDGTVRTVLNPDTGAFQKARKISAASQIPASQPNPLTANQFPVISKDRARQIFRVDAGLVSPGRTDFQRQFSVGPAPAFQNAPQQFIPPSLNSPFRGNNNTFLIPIR